MLPAVYAEQSKSSSCISCSKNRKSWMQETSNNQLNFTHFPELLHYCRKIDRAESGQGVGWSEPAFPTWALKLNIRKKESQTQNKNALAYPGCTRHPFLHSACAPQWCFGPKSRQILSLDAASLVTLCRHLHPKHELWCDLRSCGIHWQTTHKHLCSSSDALKLLFFSETPKQKLKFSFSWK